MKAMKFEDTLMHGNDWRGESLAGWYWSEKLDGCRARWDGAQLFSRSGALIKLPAELSAKLPTGVPLDLEVYAGPGGRDLAMVAVRFGKWHPSVRLVCFDAPGRPGDWAARIGFADRLGVVEVVQHGVVRDAADALDLLGFVNGAGGEGLMLARPGAAYTAGRVDALVKLKPDNARMMAAA